MLPWLQRRWRTGQLRSKDGGEQTSFKRQTAGMNGTVVAEKPHDTYRIAFHNRIRAARQ